MRVIVFALLIAGCSAAPKSGRTVGDLREDRPDGAPAEACADDAREENDTLLATASTTDAVQGKKALKLDKLVSCPGDDDWIHAWSECCNAAGVTVTWNASEGDLRVDLVDGQGAVLAMNGSDDSADRTPGKTKLMHGRHQGDFYVRIRNRSGTRVGYAAEVVAQGNE